MAGKRVAFGEVFLFSGGKIAVSFRERTGKHHLKVSMWSFLRGMSTQIQIFLVGFQQGDLKVKLVASNKTDEKDYKK